VEAPPHSYKLRGKPIQICRERMRIKDEMQDKASRSLVQSCTAVLDTIGHLDDSMLQVKQRVIALRVLTKICVKCVSNHY
jgi:hypothetical protein